jgi:tetratricopeptide (TPR) repeat protein
MSELLIFTNPNKIELIMKYCRLVLLLSFYLTASLAIGQSLDEGKNHFYSQRYELADAVFKQVLEKNSSDPSVLFWAGQTKLELEKDSTKKAQLARTFFDNASKLTNANPLIMVGAGQADLLENKVNDARQKFESALTMTKGRKGDDVEILTAIAKAALAVKSEMLDFIIERVNQQPEKSQKSAELFVLLGDVVRKAKPGEAGGEAFRNYQQALEVNSNFALASYRLAKLFDSQKNWELVYQYLSECVQKDPKFTPAYYELFYYYFYRRDFATAELQLQKFIETKQPEKDIQDEFLYSQLCWARGDFNCAITKAESVIAALGVNTKPRVYRLLADAFYQQADTLKKQGNEEAASAAFTNAKKYSDLFFSKSGGEDDQVILYDYQLRADILDKTGGTPEEIVNTYLQAVKVDTLANLKVDLLRKGADRFKARGDSLSRVLEGDLRTQAISFKPNPSQRDYFDAGFAYYQGKAYEKADSIFTVFVGLFPEEPYGYMMEYNIQRAVDSTMEKGSAVPWALKYLEILEKDTVKNAKTIIGVSGYLAAYNANILKDKDKALEYLRRMLALDPDNAAIQNNITILEKSAANKPDSAEPPSSNN